MKAGVVYGKEDIRFDDIPTPEVKKGQVLVKVKYTGICGSDIPRVNNGACHFFPNVLGHEFSGVIEKVGEGVASVKVGQRVAGVPLIPCMKCEDCLKGNYSLCKHYSFIGSREFGSFAEYVAVPETNVVPFEDEVSFEQGAFFEPATVALHGLRRVPYQGGKTVAVLGGGTIGLFVMQWAKIFGAKKVVVFDIVDERLELAKKLGADDTVNTLKDNFMADAKALTDGRGYDYVFETAGNTITMKMAFELAGNKASICFVGTPTKELSFTVKEWENMNRKEFTLTGSWMSYSAPFPGEEWVLTAHYFKTGELKFDSSLIFKKYPLSQIADAFELYKTPGAVRGKILIDSEVKQVCKMILTVTLNAAIDKAYYMDKPIKNGTVMRVSKVNNTAGGKGLNVARVIKLCGEQVKATGIVGGFNGKYLESLLDIDGVSHDFMHVDGETRSCINILDPVYGSTEYLEGGFTLTKEDEDAFLDHFKSVSLGAEVITISGSTPKGLSKDIYFKMVNIVKAQGKTVILDTSGDTLKEGIKACPTVVKPNKEELEALFSTTISTNDEVIAFADKLCKQGIPYVVVSLGGDGALLVTKDKILQGIPPKIDVVNTVGCGDSMVGAFATFLSKNYPIEDVLKYAVAVATANATSLGTGSFDPAILDEIYRNVKIKNIK